MRITPEPPGSNPNRALSLACRLLTPVLILVLGWPIAVFAQMTEPSVEQQLDDIEQRLVELLASLPAEQREAARERLVAALSKPLEDHASAVDPSAESVLEPVAEEVATVEVVPTPRAVVAPPAEPPPQRKPRRRPACRTLEPFDENGDGKVNSRDRYWRHLYLWIDKNNDGQRQERELESAYEAGIREIALELDVFYRRKGSLGEIRRGEHLLFDIRGDGFGAARKVDDGALAVDADALRRGNGPSLLQADGSVVEGIRPFEPGWRLDLGDGEDVVLECPPR